MGWTGLPALYRWIQIEVRLIGLEYGCLCTCTLSTRLQQLGLFSERLAPHHTHSTTRRSTNTLISYPIYIHMLTHSSSQSPSYMCRKPRNLILHPKPSCLRTHCHHHTFTHRLTNTAIPRRTYKRPTCRSSLVGPAVVV